MTVKFSLEKNKAKHDEKGRPWYDTMEGIQRALVSLEFFMKLVSERHTAGYDRRERLNEFYVLGRYWLDTCGNCGKISGWIPKEKIDNFPDVITKDDLWVFVKKNFDETERISITSGMDSGLPYSGVICPVCQKGWTLLNCHDTLVNHKTEVISLADFVGKTLGEVKAHFAEKTDANYRMQNDILIRNDRFIDQSPEYPESTDDWKKKQVKNKNGWVSEMDGITDEYVIAKGDEGFFNVWKYFHNDCHLRSVADNPVFLAKDGHFKNLAGAAYADIVIEKELKDVGIEIIKGDRIRSEVPFTLTGKLGTFNFVRAWAYWTVECMMPLKVAKEIYKDKVGARFVRVAGHCGCPPPEEWALPSADDLKKGMDKLGIETANYGELAEILNSGKIKAPRFVQSYHIDTMSGLKLFVQITKKHGLA